MGLQLNFVIIRILIGILEKFHKILQLSSIQNYWRIPKLLGLPSKFAARFQKNSVGIWFSDKKSDHITAGLFKSYFN